MSAANDPIKRLAKLYAEANDIPNENIEELEKIIYMAVATDPKRASEDPEYLRSVLNEARDYLQSPILNWETGVSVKRKKTKKASGSIWRAVLILLLILAGGILGLVNSTLLPEIQSNLLRFFTGGVAMVVLLIIFVYLKPRLGFVFVFLVATWQFLGWLSKIVLPASVVLGLAVVPAINMAYISRPLSLLQASVVSMAAGIAGGSSIATAGRLRKSGWWLFILAMLCTLAATTWSFMNLTDVLDWGRMVLCFVVAFIFAMRIALR